MRSIKLFTFFLGLVALTFIISCENDALSNENLPVKPSSETRTRSLGNYSIVHGRVKFPTINDYQLTTTYLQDASESEVISFRNSFSIETAAKAVVSLSEAMCCEIELTNEQMNAIEQQFNNKVKITLNADGDKEVELKYKVNPEFTNLNGEYQVGGTIVKQVGTKLISITKPEVTSPSSINENTTTNAESGIFVTETVVAAPLGCCPASNAKHCEYDPKKKKLILEYRILNISQTFVNPLDERFNLILPEIFVTANGKHEKRKCFIFCWWACDKVNLKHDFEISFFHDWASFGITNPIHIKHTQNSNPNYPKQSDSSFRRMWLRVSSGIFPMKAMFLFFQSKDLIWSQRITP